MTRHCCIRHPAGLVCVTVLTLIASFASVSNARQSDASRTYSLTDNPKFDRTVVARIGDQAITGKEFLLNYLFGPAFPKRRPDSKRRYLNLMINEKLLAREGYDMGLQRLEPAREMLKEIEGDLITEQLYREEIAPKAKATKEEVAEGVARERIHLSVKWLYEEAEAGIAQDHHFLRSGIPFDSLYARQFSDTVKQEDRSMQTTVFEIHHTNPQLAMVLDTLGPRTASLPIRTPDGWYIIELEDRWTNPIVTETENEKLRDDAERVIVQQKSDKLSDDYLDQMMQRSHPEIQRRSFDILNTYLGIALLTPEKSNAWDLEKRLHDRWGKDVGSANLSDHVHDILVKSDMRTYSVGDFMSWYNARSTFLNMRLNSPRSLFASLEQFVWRMVRDRMLVERAKRNGYDKRAGVLKEKKWWEDKIVYTLRKNMIADSVRPSEESLREFYATHTRDYRSESGAARAYDVAKDEVRHDLVLQEMNKRLLHRLIALKQRYRVEVFTAELDKIPVETEHQPQAIDVYTVKKGGTFPHRAFPSIDYEWQQWE